MAVLKKYSFKCKNFTINLSIIGSRINKITLNRINENKLADEIDKAIKSIIEKYVENAKKMQFDKLNCYKDIEFIEKDYDILLNVKEKESIIDELKRGKIKINTTKAALVRLFYNKRIDELEREFHTTGTTIRRTIGVLKKCLSKKHIKE